MFVSYITMDWLFFCWSLLQLLDLGRSVDPILQRSKWLGFQRVLFVEAVVKYEKLVSKFYISTVAKLHFSLVFFLFCVNLSLLKTLLWGLNWPLHSMGWFLSLLLAFLFFFFFFFEFSSAILEIFFLKEMYGPNSRNGHEKK